MFDGKKKSRPVELATLVGRDTEIHGDIVFRGALHVEGRVKGDITSVTEDDGALLTVGEHGVVEGEIRVPRITLDGMVIGNVFASQVIELVANARVTGNIHYHRLEMAMGAEVNGQLIPTRGTEPSSQVEDSPSEGSNGK